MTGKKRIIFTIMLVGAIVVAISIVSVWFYISARVSNLDRYKEFITQTVSKELNRKLSYENGYGSLTLRNGLAFRFTHAVIKDKDGSSDFLNVRDAFVHIGIFPLLINRIVISEVVLIQPRVSIQRDQNGNLNIADLLVEKKEGATRKIRKIVMENGEVNFLDQALNQKEVSVLFRKLDARINALFGTNRYRFKITGSVIKDQEESQFTLRGFFKPAPPKEPFYESGLWATVHLKNSNLSHFSPYLKKYTPMTQMAGHLNADIRLSGKFSDFTSKGRIDVKNALLNYPGVFRDVLRPRTVHLDYDMKRDKKRIQVDVNHVVVDRFEAQGNFRMDDLDTKDPFLKAFATTKVFVYGEIKSYVPWGIIQEDVGNFIDMHIKDGHFRLVKGTLQGRLSRIADFNSRESSEVLSIEAEVEKGIFEAHSSAPLFHDIKGILELKKRQFALKNVSARFGLSPLTIEGNISDFGLPYPTIYTAKMKIHPARGEVVWLLGDRFRNLNFKGYSTLDLFGKGTDDDYHISAQWDLTSAAYLYPGIIEKPALRKNLITADIVISEDAINLSSFNYSLEPFDIKGSMMFCFNGKIPASFNVTSKYFDFHDVQNFLPVVRKMNPRGNGSVAVMGQGDLSDMSSMQWQGNIFVNHVTLQPPVDMKPLTGLTGNALFKGSTMETSLLKAHIGNSVVKGKLRIINFKDPRITCQFSSEFVRVSDLGLSLPRGEIDLQNINGQVTFDTKNTRLDNLSFYYGQSVFNLSGEAQKNEILEINAKLTSPYIDFDDLFRILALRYPHQEKNKRPLVVQLHAMLQADAGKFQNIDFKKLNADVTYVPHILDVETLKVNVFDGTLQVKGKADIQPDGVNHYEGDVSLSRISLEKIQDYLEIGGRTVTGHLFLNGNVSATGRSADDLKRSAVGKFKIRAEKGVLKKFAVLSKIFSLLNVYQLLKFHLPDMVREGMPYNAMTADIVLKEGVLYSENFFINSDAMEMSGHGKIDFLNKKLDFIVGVHPLQVIDIIASKIPVAGWIITDEKGKLITVHFKADGSWDDPNVKPMPLQSIGKGTLDIFRRIFQWPSKLITDTGEVIFGH